MTPLPQTTAQKKNSSLKQDSSLCNTPGSSLGVSFRRGWRGWLLQIVCVHPLPSLSSLPNFKRRFCSRSMSKMERLAQCLMLNTKGEEVLELRF
ncbi:hypothetical protein CEXT_488671 [Caerostris extrusa]|uniref:Uncharacterized protein n=1 Tax=Caerostris extrusa TaxID=172846 RepID=A0AAV4NUA9_CAEEX|nr:hypothetical protein CEXT_488671 [Caerostris extrusa]